MRLVEAGVKGRHLTLKIKRKKAGAPEPVKFLVLPPSLRTASSAWVCQDCSAVTFLSCSSMNATSDALCWACAGAWPL